MWLNFRNSVNEHCGSSFVIALMNTVVKFLVEISPNLFRLSVRTEINNCDVFVMVKTDSSSGTSGLL